MKRALLSPVLALVLQAGAALGGVPAPATPRAQALWDAWPRARVSPPDPWALKHAGLRAAVDDLQTRHPGLFTIVEEGVSSEGRKIPLLRVGNGPKGVLLWSQMHGDEPTATAALLDVLNWFGANRSDPAVRELLSNLTLWIIPMLNPDGAERTQRRNAQEIDINRDALRLSSPEGRFLKAVRDRVKPVIGYNLHNQNPNLLAGQMGGQVAIALLSVPGDAALTETEGTRATKRLAVTVQRLLAPFAAGRISRYDMDYTARAFGDSMTRWGTATLLIETGGWAGPGEAERLVRLNFVALIGSLSAIADGSLEAVPSEDYARIPMNVREALFTLVLRHARLAGGRGLPPFTADLAFVVPGPFAGDSHHRREPAVVDVGDLAHAHGLTEVDATELFAVPWPNPPAGDWPSLKASLQAQGLAEVEEAALLAAVRALGTPAVARPGYEGPVLLYRPGAAGRLSLEGAILRGTLVGGRPAGTAGLPAPSAPRQ
ncbi:M14 family zinc carboxypeptidase [Geothrix oryzisoli]|uniref:M14 family zinc carboxypeptidase n=1 Tax=Geothrix oryzisoli TaxID=2922721 RepID=UPI001FAC7949|nr:M14 family zinc carboxypeptidase [Geothrix oryzisoli]